MGCSRLVCARRTPESTAHAGDPSGSVPHCAPRVTSSTPSLASDPVTLSSSCVALAVASHQKLQLNLNLRRKTQKSKADPPWESRDERERSLPNGTLGAGPESQLFPVKPAPKADLSNKKHTRFSPTAKSSRLGGSRADMSAPKRFRAQKRAGFQGGLTGPPKPRSKI